MKLKLFIFLLANLFCLNLLSQGTIGDPGRTFDSNNRLQATIYKKGKPEFNVNKEDLLAIEKRWAKAGVIGGIRKTGNHTQTIYSSKAGQDISQELINKINNVYNNGGGVVIIKKGTFKIEKEIPLKEGVTIQGTLEGGEIKTILKLNVNSGSIFKLNLLENSDSQTTGLKNIHLKGKEFTGTPGKGKDDCRFRINNTDNYRNPDPKFFGDDRVGYTSIPVEIKKSKNCYLDNVKITNAGDHPVAVRDGSHHSFRNLEVNGAWNKSGGKGYFLLAGSDCLVYNSYFEGLRHFLLQTQNCEYNVVYDNEIIGDVNFHNNDKGYNLIEKNTITIPNQFNIPPNGCSKEFPTRYTVMGPWGVNHDISDENNFVFNNTMKNNSVSSSARRANNPNLIYLGAHKFEPLPGLSNTGNPFAKSVSKDTGSKFYSTKNTSSKSAGSKTEAENVEEVLDIDNLFSVYPNPAKEIINIRLSNDVKQASIQIINTNGQKVYEKDAIVGNNSAINISNFSKGLYFIKVKTAQKVFTKKLFIN